MTFYFHDYETSGAEVASDRPVQFAGVRTDLDFNIVGEPLVIYNRPTLDCLPHPAAVRITAISPLTALQHGLPEAEFMGLINDQLAQPGTCGIGYNSLRFDDEITRYGLYRNFFEPYAREYGQGRSRWDLMDPARAMYALRPEGICWPTREDGLPSFRLEELSAANGIEHANAHDALSDVYATIGLAKVMKAAQPALFEALWSLRLKDRVAPLLNVHEMRPVIHVSGMFGAARNNLAVVVPLAEHPVNRNEIICADLGAEPAFLFESVESVRAKLFSPQASLPQGDSRPPLKTIRVNKAPVILPTEWLKGEPAERLGLDGNRHRESLAALRGARDADPKGFVQFIQSIFADRDFPARADPDTRLYDGFFQRADSALFPKIRAATPEELRDQSWVFRDRRLPELLFRYRARNYPDSLTTEERGRWREHCRSKFTDVSQFTLSRFHQELHEQRIIDGLAPVQVQALDDLEHYVQGLCQELALDYSGWHASNSG